MSMTFDEYNSPLPVRATVPAADERDQPERPETIVAVFEGHVAFNRDPVHSFTPLPGFRAVRLVVPYPWHFAPDDVTGVCLRSLWTGDPRLGPKEALEAARERRHGFRLADAEATSCPS